MPANIKQSRLVLQYASGSSYCHCYRKPMNNFPEILTVGIVSPREEGSSVTQSCLTRLNLVETEDPLQTSLYAFCSWIIRLGWASRDGVWIATSTRPSPEQVETQPPPDAQSLLARILFRFLLANGHYRWRWDSARGPFPIAFPPNDTGAQHIGKIDRACRC